MTRYELKAIRVAHGLTQESMAERVGLSWRQYQRIESGNSRVDETLAKLVRLLFNRGVE